MQAGGLTILADPHHCRQDARLILRAVREGWPVSQERRPQIVRRLAEVIQHTKDARAVALCAKVFVEMDRLQLDAAKAAVALVKAQQAQPPSPQMAVQVNVDRNDQDGPQGGASRFQAMLASLGALVPEMREQREQARLAEEAGQGGKALDGEQAGGDGERAG